jgi:hypothetical protein
MKAMGSHYLYSRISQHFMEPKGLLLWSQEPTTCPILIQMNSVHFFWSHFFHIILMLSSSLYLGLPSGLFCAGYPTRMLYACIFHACCISHPRFDHFQIFYSQALIQASCCMNSICMVYWWFNSAFTCQEGIVWIWITKWKKISLMCNPHVSVSSLSYARKGL